MGIVDVDMAIKARRGDGDEPVDEQRAHAPHNAWQMNALNGIQVHSGERQRTNTATGACLDQFGSQEGHSTSRLSKMMNNREKRERERSPKEEEENQPCDMHYSGSASFSVGAMLTAY